MYSVSSLSEIGQANKPKNAIGKHGLKSRSSRWYDWVYWLCNGISILRQIAKSQRGDCGMDPACSTDGFTGQETVKSELERVCTPRWCGSAAWGTTCEAWVN